MVKVLIVCGLLRLNKWAENRIELLHLLGAAPFLYLDCNDFKPKITLGNFANKLITSLKVQLNVYQE